MDDQDDPLRDIVSISAGTDYSLALSVTGTVLGGTTTTGGGGGGVSVLSLSSGKLLIIQTSDVKKTITANTINTLGVGIVVLLGLLALSEGKAS